MGWPNGLPRAWSYTPHGASSTWATLTRSCCAPLRPSSRTADAASVTTMPKPKLAKGFGCLWSRLKTEELETRKWPVFAELADTQASIADYFDHHYRHASIGYQKPINFTNTNINNNLSITIVYGFAGVLLAGKPVRWICGNVLRWPSGSACRFPLWRSCCSACVRVMI